MLSSENKSFFLILLITAVTLYAALVVTREVSPIIAQRRGLSAQGETKQGPLSHIVINTSDWKTYEDPTYPINFKYPKDWSVTTYTNDDPNVGYIIVLDPNIEHTDNIRIYINSKNYLALTGFDTEKRTVNGISAITVNDVLAGMKQGSNFITFDVGTTLELVPYFQAILNTVEITK